MHESTVTLVTWGVGLATTCMIPAIGWVHNRSVKHGERLTKLETRSESSSKDVQDMGKRIDKRFDELRNDIKELFATKVDREYETKPKR